jgi:MFS family permease
MDITPLKTSRDFRLLYIGQFISMFGSAISYVVLPWQMYQLTKSSFAVGMLGIAEFVPMFVMAFVGGALADYIDRRRLILLAEIAMIGCCAILIANTFFEHPRVWVLLLVASLFAALNGVHQPALGALTPRLIEPDQVPAVSGLTSFRGSFNFIVGQSLAGVFVVKLGPGLAYAIDAGTFVASLWMLWMIRTPPPFADADRPSLQTIREGWRYARGRQELLGTYLIDINAMFFGMPMALLPAIAEGYGGAALGLFYAMPPTGALIVSLTSGWAGRIQRHGLAVTIAAAVWGLGIVGFGLAKSLWVALVFLALAGAADMVSGIFRMTIWNQTIPDHLRGRLAGIEMISYLTGPYLGNAEAGLVASVFGLRASVVSGGILCVLGSGALALLLPKFIAYEGREGLARKEAEEAARAKEALGADIAS